MAATNGTCRNPGCRAGLPPSADRHRRGRRRLYCDWRCRDQHQRTIALAQAGRNTSCIDCGNPPLAGGLRCHPCFAANTTHYTEWTTGHQGFPLAAPPAWADRARCVDADPDAFFGGRGHPVEPAKAICRRCPVQRECLQWAIERGEEFGVWGGTSPRERLPMLQGEHRRWQEAS